jgi:hypothetical protein
MTELLIQLKGEDDDLDALCGIFRSLSYRVSKEEDGYYYLRSSHLPCTVGEEDRDERAAELVMRLNVAARLLLGGNYFPVDFDGVARMDEDSQEIIRRVSSVLQVSWRVRSHYEAVSPSEAESLIAALGKSELNRSVNLLAQSLDMAAEDKFKSFLFGWTALEILINKVFSEYEKAFLSAVSSESSVHGTSRYFERVTQVMRDKYRLVDKFGIIAAVLTAEESDHDIEEFERIKKVRDALLHGQDAPELSLLNVELRDLVSKYLRKHLSRDSP